MTQIGSFMRYSVEKHRALLSEFPHLEPILFRETYKEAEAAAKAWCERIWRDVRGDKCPDTHGPGGTCVLTNLPTEIQWVHHPHSETEDTGKNDPLNLAGSWGWKTE